MSLATLMVGLDADISKFSRKLAKAGSEAKNFGEKFADMYDIPNKALSSHIRGLKDTTRIVQGILVSQAFYTTARSIREATSSLIAFNEELDYANVTYSALFGSSDLAEKFVKALQEHSVNTIFDYSQLAGASKKLLAYGIEYKNLMYVMEGLTNLGAMSGDAAALDRISLALGQIKTTGYLTGSEMRQLANAYVPIYDIVKETFDLTGEQMKRVGDLKLPAHQVINAIVDYANAKFGEVGEAAMMTITGLKNRVVDTLKVMGSNMMQPLTKAWKSFLLYASGVIETIRELYEAGGWGAIFEKLVPDPAAQTTIRAFFANFHNLLMSLLSVASALGSVFGQLGQTFMMVFNILAPVITGVANVLAATTKALMENAYAAALLRTAALAAAVAFAILKVHAAGLLIIKTVTKAMVALGKAMMILASNPLVMLAVGLAAALLGVAVAGNNANNSLSGLFKTLSGVGGTVDQDDILKETEHNLGDAANAADSFNDRLTAGSDAADELADSVDGVGKAAKKTKGLLSFDEVFKLPENNAAGAGTGVLDDIANLTDGLFDFGDAIGGALIPEIPDFSDYISDFTDGLFGGLEDGIIQRLKNTALGALLGAGIGGIIGGLLGGPAGAALGAKIGALAGGIIGMFWDEIKNALNFTDTSAIAALVPTVIGAALGFTAFGIPGALLGGAIGALASNLVSTIWQKIGDALGRSQEDVEFAQIASSLAAGIGAILGFVIGGPGGALIGAGIGTLVGGLLGLFKERVIEVFKDFDISAAIATALTGAMVGMTSGNPLFAFMGALGGFVMGGFFEGIDKAISDIGTWVKEHIFEPFVTWFKKLFRINSPSLVMKEFGVFVVQGFLEGLVETWVLVGQWLTDSFESFRNWYNNLIQNTIVSLDTIKQNWLTKWNEIKTNALNKWNETKASFTTWWNDITRIDTTRLTEIKRAWSDSWNTVKVNASTKWNEIKSNLVSWLSGIKLSNSTTLGEVATDWSTKWSTIRTNASTTWSNIRSGLVTWLSGIKTSNTTTLSEVVREWSSKWNEIKTNLAKWWDGMHTSMSGWLEDKIWRPISDFFNLNRFWNRLSGLLDSIKYRLSSWWDSITSIFDTNFSVSANVNTYGYGGVRLGHAAGGVFNREHIARFAEGDKAEAIIPLENEAAMRPFVDAVSNGIVESLAPIVASVNGGGSNLPPMYVGTLIADDRGIKQLYKKFEVIQAQEDARRGRA